MLVSFGDRIEAKEAVCVALFILIVTLTFFSGKSTWNGLRGKLPAV